MYMRILIKRALILTRGYPLANYGEEKSGCAYTICTKGLGTDSVVYSGGVGKDVSFEHALAQNFGCDVVLFDPSPIGLATMNETKNNNPKFHFFPVGLAGQVGTLRLAPPFTPEGDSWFAHDGGTIEVPCLDLPTLMQKNGHRHIDLLKIDVEGAEYGIIDQIVSQNIPVRQIVVEFHDNILPGIRLSQSLRATFKLLKRGYKFVFETGNTDVFFWGRSWQTEKKM